ncbi:MAG: ribonuclease HI [Rickettsiales bacterium]|nr:ribonuclease HI [Rickettsiales bacterium]
MLKCWTDGSCLGNPGNGGWAFIMTDGKRTVEKSGGAKDSTNNRMELTAVIEALGSIKNNNELEIVTDSEYVKNGIETWIKNWKKKGWRGSNGKPVANQDLWTRLDALTPKFKIKWTWVRGHTGDRMNERCDTLAYSAASAV